MTQTEPTLFYKRTVTPGINLVDHARGLGIHLKSNRLTQYGSPRKGIASPRYRASALTARNAKSCPPSIVGVPATSYIEDVVVPLATKTDEQNVKEALSPRPFSARDFTPRLKHKSEARAKSSTLPHMGNGGIPNNSPRSSAKSIRTLSTFLEKYNVSSTPVDQAFLTRSTNEYHRKWNTSEQASRFETEQKKREKGRVLKRTSEIKPHRIDRMYYMSGTHIPLGTKYDVDDAELERLKDLSRARQESRHYGRGLSSHRGDKYNPDMIDKEPPHQPPPSSLSHNPDQPPLLPEGTIVNHEQETVIDDENVTTGRPSTAVTLNKGNKVEETGDEESTGKTGDGEIETQAAEENNGPEAEKPAEDKPEQPDTERPAETNSSAGDYADETGDVEKKPPQDAGDNSPLSEAERAEGAAGQEQAGEEQVETEPQTEVDSARLTAETNIISVDVREKESS